MFTYTHRYIRSHNTTLENTYAHAQHTNTHIQNTSIHNTQIHTRIHSYIHIYGCILIHTNICTYIHSYTTHMHTQDTQIPLSHEHISDFFFQPGPLLRVFNTGMVRMSGLRIVIPN